MVGLEHAGDQMNIELVSQSYQPLEVWARGYRLAERAVGLKWDQLQGDPGNPDSLALRRRMACQGDQACVPEELTAGEIGHHNPPFTFSHGSPPSRYGSPCEDLFVIQQTLAQFRIRHIQDRRLA